MENPLDRQKKAVSHSEAHKCITLPPNISEILCRDPRLIGFIAARHKLVAKHFCGMDILEVGCQEGFGSLFIAPYVKAITSIDFYGPFIEGYKKYALPHLENCNVFQADITSSKIRGDFDGAFALDVLEHIHPNQEDKFWKNMSGSIKDNGSIIIGMPSLESQIYASEASKLGHINCKNGDILKKNAQKYFSNVFMLSMNDEMLHNGYMPMSHYIFAICSGKINNLN